MATLPLGYIPVDLKEMTPDWLTAALKISGVISIGRVTRIETAPGETWHIAQTACISVHYTERTEPLPPATFFVKLAIFDDPLASVLEGEYAFYGLNKPEGLPVPKCYGAFFDKETLRSCLILEDLSGTHKATPWPQQLSRSDSAITIDALAEIHGHYVISADRQDRAGSDELAVKEEILSRHFTAMLTGFFDMAGEHLSEGQRNLISLAFERFPVLKANRVAEGRPTTIVHGDPHAWNVMFPVRQSEPASCILIDWEDWRYDAGAADLAYMMALNWHHDRKTRDENDLLRQYHQALSSSLEQPYAWDELMLDYRIALLQHIVTPVYLQQIRPKDSIWLEQLERWFAAVDDLDCRDLLNA